MCDAQTRIVQRTYAKCDGLPKSLELAVACCVQLLLHRTPAMTATYSQTGVDGPPEFGVRRCVPNQQDL
ncbi:hypothetical protein AGR7A_pTi0058 [Agrobacterium deltaense NCPPB 1641]|uniref:Uncharacterized protein n=1 Tax=Agrobacterium deltaense NCPPB 1641 TaxID=1183425 RepID=A0A1S7UC04_9HYPH|nr:hypothetical protein AGR7A_pTi0058 [Agrobacterium deltaense NCPPB 1641]